MKVQLKSQIDINHWTITIVDGPWQGKEADVRLEKQKLERSQVVEGDLEFYAKYKEPSVLGYCGIFTVTKAGTADEKLAKKKTEKVVKTVHPHLDLIKNMQEKLK